MTKEMALRILQFLENAPMTGKDVIDFINCVNALKAIAHGSEFVDLSKDNKDVG